MTDGGSSAPVEPQGDGLERLTAEFVRTSLRLDAAMAERGYERTIEREVDVVTHDGGGGWSVDSATRAVPVLVDPPADLLVPPLLTNEDLDRVTATCIGLASTPGADLPFFSPFGFGSHLFPREPRTLQFAEDPDLWVRDHLVLPALTNHLGRMSSSESEETAAAAWAFAVEVMSVLVADVLNYKCSVPLSGVTCDQAWASGGVLIRPLTDEEQAAFIAAQFPGPVGGRLPLPRRTTDLPRAMLEMLVHGPRRQHHGDYRQELSQVVVAFALKGYEVATPGFMGLQSDPPWVFAGHLSSPLLAASRSRVEVSLSQEGLDEVVATAQLLQRFDLVRPQTPKDVCLHRFALGCAREAEVDAVVDFVVALEGLLLPYDADARHGDLSYRFRLHGAVFVATEPEERRRVRRQLNKLYSLRSRLVHGSGGYPEPQELRDELVALRALTARALLKAVNEGFPSAENLNDLVLPSPPEEE